MTNSRNGQTYVTALFLTSLLFALTACGDTMGPDVGDNGSAVPNVAGTWSGTYGDPRPISMVLTQDGREVTGVLTFPGTQYQITGRINGTGRLDFANQLDAVNCTLYVSFRGLGLSADGRTLQGQVERTQLESPCTGTNPMVRVSEQNQMLLTR